MRSVSNYVRAEGLDPELPPPNTGAGHNYEFATSLLQNTYLFFYDFVWRVGCNGLGVEFVVKNRGFDFRAIPLSCNDSGKLFTSAGP